MSTPEGKEKLDDNMKALALNDPIKELFDVGNKYLMRLEGSIGEFLEKNGITGKLEKNNTDNNDENYYKKINKKINSYDKNLDGNENHFEKLNKQANVDRIKNISSNISEKKTQIIKQKLTMQMIAKMMTANSKDHVDLLSILKENKKEHLHSDIIKIKKQEINDYKKDLNKINEKFKNEVGYTEKETKEKNIKKISSSNEKILKKISQNSNDTVAINEFKRNAQEAKNLGIEKEVSLKLAKYVEYAFQSGVLPLAMLSNGTLRKALPLLPSLIGVGIWSRLINGTINDKALALGKTALAIAPITGSRVALQDALKAKGTGNKIAAWTGFTVSAGFDAFTVFLVATGIGAPAAIGTQALKITAKESAKLAVKKIFSFFSKKVVEKSPRAYGTLGETTKSFLKGKLNIITTAIEKKGLTNFIKEVGKQSLKDTVEGMWNIISFKGVREVRGINWVNKRTFGKAAEITKPARIKLFERMEKAGVVKEGATKRAKAAGTIEELRLIEHERLKHSEEHTKEKNISEIESSSNLTKTIDKIEQIAKSNDSNFLEYKEILNSLKKQDKSIGYSMDTVKKITEEVNDLNSGVLNKEQTIEKIEQIMNSVNGKISDGLTLYLNRVISKISKGEDFGENSGNYLLLLSKFNGQISVAAYNNKPKVLKEYYDLIKNGEKDSQLGYMGNYTNTIAKFKKTIEGGSFNPKKENKLILTYMDLIKAGEQTGWGTIRTELTNNGLTKEINTGKVDNGYEYSISQLLKTKSVENKTSLILENIDFSMIHSKSILKEITKMGFDQIMNNHKTDFNGSIRIIKTLSKNKQSASELKNHFYGIGIVNGSNKPQAVLGYLTSNTKSNKNLLEIVDYVRIDRKSIRETIKNNVLKNDQINGNIGKNKEYSNKENENKKPITKEALDKIIRKLKSLKDSNYKEAIDGIIVKYNGNDSYNLENGYIKTHETTKSEIENFIFKMDKNGNKVDLGMIESYDNAAELSILYRDVDGVPENISNIIIKSKDYSIDYKIKYLISLEKKGKLVDKNKYETIVEKYKNDLKEFFIQNIDNRGSGKKYSNIVKNLDNLEAFYIKNGGNEKNKLILDKIDEIKNTSSQYKEQDKNVTKIFTLLLDLDRTHSMEYLKMQKTAGNITYKTKELLKQYSEAGAILDSGGKVIKTLDSTELKKLNQVREQVKEALEHYEFNLFDPKIYNGIDNNNDKIEYIFKTIDQQSGWKLSKNGNQKEERAIIKTITNKLNSTKSHFEIKGDIINGFVSKILNNTSDSALSINGKVHLLKLLERANVIKPSAEQKLDYIIDLKAKNTNDFRDGTSNLKEYSKHFDEHLSQGNQRVIEIKVAFKDNPKEAKIQMEEYIKTIIDTKTPVSDASIENKGSNFLEGRDWVEINGKNYITEVYPSRYFALQLTDSKLDLKQKEAYMEMIHNKTEFGGKSFEQYFDSVTDVETKILMSYHDEIKYNPKVLKLLKDNASNPKYNEIISYVISKRKDIDLLQGGLGKQLDKGVLSSIITKKALEEKMGTKIDNTKYNEILSQYERIFIALKSFTDTQIGARGLDDLIPNINKLVNESYIKIDEAYIKQTYRDINNRVSFLETILKDNILSKLVIGSRTLGEEFNHQLYTKEKTLGLTNRENAGIIGRGTINLNDILNRPLTKADILRGEKIGSTLQITDNINKLVHKDILMPLGITSSEANLIESTVKKLDLKTVLGILIMLGIMTPTQAEAAAVAIDEQWKNHPQHTEYNKLISAKEVEKAMAIKSTTINEITAIVLDELILDFKDKYEAKYLKEFQDFPSGLSDLASKLHEKLSPSLSDQSIKGKHKFAKGIYDFISHYNKEDGKALKYAKKLLEKSEGINGTPLAKIILEMGENSDTEHAKTPEQKQREHEEYMKNAKQSINESQQSIDKENEKQNKSQQNIDKSQQNIDKSQQNIDKSQQNIDKRNNLMKSLESMIDK